MSVILFELKEEHVKLLKHLNWSVLDNKFLVSTENYLEDPAPFGVDNLYEGIDLILNGKPKEFDPFNSEELKSYSDEEKIYMDKLMSELPVALDIILYNGSFELGTYKTKFHVRNWKKVAEK